jgi:hypothetical protein
MEELVQGGLNRTSQTKTGIILNATAWGIARKQDVSYAQLSTSPTSPTQRQRAGLSRKILISKEYTATKNLAVKVGISYVHV